MQERQENRLTVNVQAEDQLEHVEFDTRRAWSIKVTQIPCGCSSSTIDRSEYVPKAPTGCLQFHEGISGDIKSFNYDSLCCYRYGICGNIYDSYLIQYINRFIEIFIILLHSHERVGKIFLIS